MNLKVKVQPSQAFVYKRQLLAAKEKSNMHLSIYLSLISVYFVGCGSVSLEEDLRLSHSEKVALDKFRDRVGPKLPHSYMLGDLYLIRWLRARKFNLDAAEQMLMDNIEWRRIHKMDNILNEKWNDLEDYRYSIEGCDLEGRPVLSVHLGDWDIRRQVIAGQGPRLARYIDRLIEELTQLIRNAQDNGRNITQISLVLDLANYNLKQHGCPLCIPVQLHFLRTLQQHYPGNIHKLTIINTPDAFQPVLALMKPIFSAEARRIISFYGRDRAEWTAALLRESQKQKLTSAYGGTRESPWEIEEFRKLGYFDCNMNTNNSSSS